MSESLVKYLAQRRQPISAHELAAAVLHMKNIPEPAAVTIVARLLEGQKDVDRVSEDTWVYRSTPSAPVNDMTYLLVRAQPAQCARWQEWASFGCVLWSNGRARFSQSISAAGRAAFSRDLQSLLLKIKVLSPAFVILDGFGNQISLLASAMADLLGEALEAPVFNIRKSAQILFPEASLRTPEQLAHQLDMRIYADGDAGTSLADLQTLWEHFIARFDETGAAESFAQLLQQAAPFDFSPYAFDAAFVRSLPQMPGIYLMRDREGSVIYVGKSKNLAQRVGSYFLPGVEPDEKLIAIRQRIYNLEFHVTGSELEALLLEYELIRAIDPAINRQIQVHERPQRQRGRYPRVILLPAADPGFIRLFCLHPDFGLWHGWLGADHHDEPPASADIWPALVQEISWIKSAAHAGQLIFDFLEGRLPASRELAQLAFTWLGPNQDAVNSIDLRHLCTKEECARILEQYRTHVLTSAERIIAF